eukprot:1136247-Pelagomonas_calceolata.AAC.2
MRAGAQLKNNRIAWAKKALTASIKEFQLVQHALDKGAWVLLQRLKREGMYGDSLNHAATSM